MLDYQNLAPIHRTFGQIEKSLWECATLPIHSNSKICATKNGYKSGVKNTLLSRWLDCNYNIAISLPLSNLICIDVDMHGDIDGLKSFLGLVKELGEIDSYTELTATNGGLHIFVSKEGISESVKNCDLAKGVELKINGYVVCAPSIYNGKQYKIVGGVESDGSYKFAKLNDKWLKFINEKPIMGKRVSAPKTIKKQKFIVSETSLNYTRMIENCRLLKFMYNNPDEIKEPTWFAVISMLTRNTNTDDFIHWLSQGHSNYTYAETNYKIERCRNSNIHCGCNYIANNYYEYCQGCPKAEQIKRRFDYGK